MTTTLLDIGKEMGLDEEQVKKFARAFWQAHYHKVVKTCAVCDKELSDEDFRVWPRMPYDFHHTCAEHSQHRRSFQVEIIRKELGFPYYAPDLITTKFNFDDKTKGS